MDPILLVVIAFLVMFLLIAMHVPIGLAMATVGVAGFAYLSSFNAGASLLASETITAISSLDIAVLPLFLLMGNFANAAGISEDFFKLAYALLGRWRGGLPMSTVLGNGLFGTICGSSFAATATFGRIAWPEMRKRGYGASLSAGSIAAGGDPILFGSALYYFGHLCHYDGTIYCRSFYRCNFSRPSDHSDVSPGHPYLCSPLSFVKS